MLSHSINTETKLKHERAVRASIGAFVPQRSGPLRAHSPGHHKYEREREHEHEYSHNHNYEHVLPTLPFKQGDTRPMCLSSHKRCSSPLGPICLSPEASESIGTSLSQLHARENIRCEDSEYLRATRERYRRKSLSEIEDYDLEMSMQSFADIPLSPRRISIKCTNAGAHKPVSPRRTRLPPH